MSGRSPLPPEALPPGILAHYAQGQERDRLLLDAARAVEHEPSLAGLSAHLMAVGRAT